MKDVFDALIDSFICNKIGITNDFLSAALLSQLKNNLLELYVANAFSGAGTGSNKLVHYDAQFRGDHIYWLDRSHNNASENAFFNIMDAFILYLNETCYTGITNYEFHYALYNEGTYYKKHIDQFQEKDNRKYSMIIYLNTDWIIGDGGELCIHHSNNTIQNIAPNNGKSVFFKSNQLEHEVLLTNKPRLSITGWLKS